MKILINGYYNFLPKSKATFSGPRNLLESFLVYLDKEGYAYTCLVLMGKKNKDAKVTKKRIKVGKSSWLVTKLRLNTPDVFGAKKPSIPKSLDGPLFRIKKVITAEKPDLVFINGMSIANWFIIKAAYELEIPLIVNHLGLWFKEITSYGGSPAGLKIMREMEKDSSRLASKNIFLSKLSYKEFNKGLIKVPKNKYELVFNPVDNVYTKGRITKPVKRNNIKIGIVARWDPIKNHKAILKLVKEAKKQRLPWEFYSVTTLHKKYSWSKDIKDEYEKNINIVRPMTPDNLKKFYEEMNILLLPSHFDVSPTVVMEAMFRNRTTLISSTVGLANTYQENGGSDLIVNFSKPKEVIKKIKKEAYKNPPKKLVKFIKSNYQGKNVYPKYLNIIKSLIK